MEFSTRSVGGWREWRAGREDPDGRDDGENVREISLVSPFKQSCVCLGLYNENSSERTPIEGKKNFFWSFPGMDMSEKLSYWVYSHPSTKTETINLPSQRISGTQASFQRQKSPETYSSPLEDLFYALCFTNCQLEKQDRSQHHILGSIFWGFQETPGRAVSYGETSHICPGGAVHLATVFCTEWTIFQSDRGVFPTFLFLLVVLFCTINQVGWAERLAGSSVSGNARCTPFLNPGLFFTERGPSLHPEGSAWQVSQVLHLCCGKLGWEQSETTVGPWELEVPHSHPWGERESNSGRA